MSPESKRKLSESLKKTWTAERRAKNAELAKRTHCGKKRSAETRRKLSETKLGAKNPNYNSPMSKELRDFHKNRMRKLHVEGKVYTWKDFSGDKHWNWKGGITSESLKIRHSEEYKNWRTAVFEKDNYQCVICGQVGGTLNADHLKPFSIYPELRFEVSNGRTMCKDCHKAVGWNYPRHLSMKKKLVEMEVLV